MSESPQNAAAPADTSPPDASEATDSSSNESETNSNELETNNVTQLVDQLIRAKRLTYSQYQTLSQMVLADGTVDEEERCQINRLFDAIQAGAIRIEKK